MQSDEEFVKNNENNTGNLPEYILNRALDPGILYEDKRQNYKNKYSKIFDNISTDSNINGLC
jgi:hypothetical protein